VLRGKPETNKAANRMKQAGRIALPVFSALFLLVSSLSPVSARLGDPEDFSEEIEERGPVRVYATRVEELLDSSPSSPYVHLIRELSRDFEKDLSLQVMPYRRAVRSFLDDRQSCLYIANEDFDYSVFGSPDLRAVRYSKPLNRLRIKFYVLEGKHPPMGMESLRGMTIAAEAGAYSIAMGDVDVTSRARMMQVESLQAALALLSKGRVDAIASYSLDLAQFELQHGEQRVIADTDFGIADIYERLACWQGGSRTHLLDAVDTEIEKAVLDGRWREILGKGAEAPF